MYKIFKNVISVESYNLSDMLSKINTMWTNGNLTDNERDELIEMARENADYAAEVDVMRKLEDMDERLRVIEQKLSDSTEVPAPEENIPEYEVGKWYRNGDKISFAGKVYICVAPDGQICVWNPKEYPTYWELVE